MGRTGRYSLRVYVGGELMVLDSGDDVIPLWEWTELACVVDGRDVRLMRDGRVVRQATAPGEGVVVGDSPLYIARAGNGNQLGGANLSTLNGAIDDISVWDETKTMGFTPSYADLNLPDGRYDGDRLRSRFHGKPGINWTNETHGLYYNPEDNLWHAFFQRTGSAPVMSHQHWGHIVSDDLLTWRDEKPALAPSEFYDIKGCWSGCVFTDDEITGGKPAILYTGVDYARPYVGFATTDDTAHLRDWQKDSRNPVYLEGDWRDTYFFRDDSGAYFIIGGPDAVKLYKYDNGWWRFDGDFYVCQEGVDRGFTEMPNVTFIPYADKSVAGGKWLMTTSPLASVYGTACLYRSGDISGGRFTAYSDAAKVDLLGRDGFGLLSPSVATTPDGKVVAMGIVPDKLPTADNIRLGYAHLYSLPREWSLDNDGSLIQKPYSGIKALRAGDDDGRFIDGAFLLDGVRSVNPVRGREAEVRATFIVGDSRFGINFLKNAAGQGAQVVYDPASGELAVDFGAMPRLRQDPDRSRFGERLPRVPSKGEALTIHLFIDHSIVDVFVNDRYAASVRVYPTDEGADLIELFADGKTQVKAVEAYILGEGDVAPEPVEPAEPEIPETTGKVAMYVGSSSFDGLDTQEKAACGYFQAAFPSGKVFYGTVDGLLANDYDCLWIHVDRVGLERGWQNLPGGCSDAAVVDALKGYIASGGNLYLSGFATQLAVAVGRTGCNPEEFNSGDGGVGNDVWQVNISANGIDHSGHPMFYGLDVANASYGKLVDLLGNPAGLHREDHNCLWRMNDFGGHDNFCATNNARVLGTWGHDGGQPFAGIVEFLPVAHGGNRAISQDAVDSRRGTIVSNGLAACQWAPRTEGGAAGVNLYRSNLEDMTSNILAYLSPKSVIPSSLADAVGREQMKLSVADGIVRYDGADGGEQVDIYSMDGRLVAKTTIPAGSGTIAVDFRGPAVVTVRGGGDTMVVKACF